jgi:hypothetical protein
MQCFQSEDKVKKLKIIILNFYEFEFQKRTVKMPFLTKSKKKVEKTPVQAANREIIKNSNADADSSIIEKPAVENDAFNEEIEAATETHKTLVKELKQKQELLRRVNLVKSYKSRVSIFPNFLN